MTGKLIEASAVAAMLSANGLDSLDSVFAYEGGKDLDKPNLRRRRRTRLDLTDGQGGTHAVFLKRYPPQSWPQMIRRWLASGRFASPARVERDSIVQIAQAGIATMQVIAWGEEGCCGRGRSYLAVTAVPGEALERYGDDFWRRLLADAKSRGEFTADLARLAASLHAAGLVHRDFYSPHIFANREDGRTRLYLIDLARVFRPRWRRFRWRVKDLAQLYHSMPREWIAQCWKDFLRQYLGGESPGLDRWQKAVERKERRIKDRAKKGKE